MTPLLLLLLPAVQLPAVTIAAAAASSPRVKELLIQAVSDRGGPDRDQLTLACGNFLEKGPTNTLCS